MPSAMLMARQSASAYAVGDADGSAVAINAVGILARLGSIALQTIVYSRGYSQVL
jgi:hypothetical protein